MQLGIDHSPPFSSRMLCHTAIQPTRFQLRIIMRLFVQASEAPELDKRLPYLAANGVLVRQRVRREHGIAPMDAKHLFVWE